MINWTTTKEETGIIVKIAKRAVALSEELGLPIKREQLTIIMDITACHGNGCPLKLQELLDAGDSEFAHDVFGIRDCIDRKTGKLENCFLPRYAVNEETKCQQ